MSVQVTKEDGIATVLLDRPDKLNAYRLPAAVVQNSRLAELGMPGQYEHAVVRDAYARTIAAARKYGKHTGIGGLASKPKLMAEFVERGARYVSTGTDLSYLMAAATERAQFVRNLKV